MKTEELLKTVPYFRDLPLSDLEDYVNQAKLVHLKCGEILFAQGATDKDAYILLDGRLRAEQENPGEPKTVLGEIGKGEIVGEMAALMGSPRSASIVALRNSVLMLISADQLVGLLQREKESLVHLAATIARRSDRSYHRINGQLGSVALVAVTPGVDLVGFARQLLPAVTQFTPAHLLSPEALKQEKSVDPEDETSIDRNGINHLLAGIEDEHPLVLYVAGEKWSQWTHCIAGRADKVVLLADAGNSPQPGAFELQLRAVLDEINHVPVELVLLHPSRNQRLAHTRLWLENREVERHHHLVKNEAASFAKLARFLTGNAVGVALSGGGFKAGLQAGILHAMAEGGMPIDIVGGSSGGAYVGAAFSMVSDLNDLPRMIEDAHKQFKGVKSITFPMVSVFSGKKFTNNFIALFGDREVEDLWTSYFCLSLSLVSGDLMVHQHGPLWQAVRASSSVMGLVPPVILENDCLVDGGFINPCPTNILMQKGAGKVVVINARSPSGIKVGAQFPPTVSGWNLLFKRLNPFYKDKIAPGIGANIVHSMFIASDHLLKQVYAESEIDLFISPSIASESSSDGEAIKKLYHFGYEYAQKEVAQWKSELGFMN